MTNDHDYDRFNNSESGHSHFFMYLKNRVLRRPWLLFLLSKVKNDTCFYFLKVKNNTIFRFSKVKNE